MKQIYSTREFVVYGAPPAIDQQLHVDRPSIDSRETFVKLTGEMFDVHWLWSIDSRTRLELARLPAGRCSHWKMHRRFVPNSPNRSPHEIRRASPQSFQRELKWKQ
jgi:hypothetical protein